MNIYKDIYFRDQNGSFQSYPGIMVWKQKDAARNSHDEAVENEVNWKMLVCVCILAQQQLFKNVVWKFLQQINS